MIADYTKENEEMNNRYTKTYYLVAGNNEQVDDEMFTNKAKAIKQANANKKLGIKWDILIYKGCEDDELANYIGQVTP